MALFAVTGSADVAAIDRSMNEDGTTTPLTSYSLPMDVLSSRTGVSTVSSPRWPCEPSAPPVPASDYDDDDYDNYYYSRASAFSRQAPPHQPPTLTVSSCGL